jgi:hypothetical protein
MILHTIIPFFIVLGAGHWVLSIRLLHMSSHEPDYITSDNDFDAAIKLAALGTQLWILSATLSVLRYLLQS